MVVNFRVRQTLTAPNNVNVSKVDGHLPGHGGGVSAGQSGV